MKIYSVRFDYDHYDTCLIDEEACHSHYPDMAPLDYHERLDGTKQGARWWPRFLKRSYDSPLGDIVSKSSDVLVMNNKSIEKLLPIIGNVEVLPVCCDFGDYHAINILTVLDCLDLEKSECCFLPKRNENEALRLLTYKKLVFQEPSIGGHHIFKIPEANKTLILADEVFVREVERNNITGFRFVLEWESEAE